MRTASPPRLSAWLDPKATDGFKKKLGAYVYRLNIVFRGLGQIALRAVRKGHRHYECNS
jgi:hypothetical protein